MAAETAPTSAAYRRKPEEFRCLVEDCMVGRGGLPPQTAFSVRFRLCSIHMHATTVVVRPGVVPQRFCQKCTTLHALEAFDAALRSCRKSLDRHKEQRRQKRARQTAAAGSAAAASPRAKGGTAAGVGSGPSAEPVGEDGAVVLAMMSAKPEGARPPAARPPPPVRGRRGGQGRRSAFRIY